MNLFLFRRSFLLLTFKAFPFATPDYGQVCSHHQRQGNKEPLQDISYSAQVTHLLHLSYLQTVKGIGQVILVW